MGISEWELSVRELAGNLMVRDVAVEGWVGMGYRHEYGRV